MTRDQQVRDTLIRLRDNPKEYIEEFLHISIKAGKVIPFKLNVVQNKVLVKIQELRRLGLPVRIIILKARQTGISTLTSAIIFHNAIFNTEISSFIIAHNKNATQHLFKMGKLFYDHLPNDQKPMTRYNNKYELTFENPNPKERAEHPGLRSSIKVETAGNKDALRSFTVQNLHISELAFWERPEETMNGIMQSVPSNPNTMVIVESTAKGMGNYFYKLWTDAVARKNEWIPIFIPWWELEEYTMPVASDFVMTDYEHENYSNEEKIKRIYKLTNEQMFWRRNQIRNSHNNNLNDFNQEYPDSALTAFVSTGNAIFDKTILTQYEAEVKIPIIGRLKFIKQKPEDGTHDLASKNKVEFIEDVRGNLRIWKFPEEDNRYNVGCDTAEGIASSTDPSCAEVLCQKNKEQVAEFSQFIKPEDFAIELIKLGTFYNTAQLVVEANSTGGTVLYVLKINGYSRVYHRRNLLTYGQKPGREPGWKTTSKTKHLMIDTLVADMDEHSIIINGIEVINEMVSYVEVQKDTSTHIKMGASSGFNDDRVIAIAIANITWDSMPILRKEKKEKEDKDHIQRNKYTGRIIKD